MPASTDRGTAATGLQRLHLAQVLGVVTVLPLVVVLVAIVVGIITLNNQSAVRDELVNRVQPADEAALTLGTALVDQETGVRGYELAALHSFLQPYISGLRQERQALAQLKRSSVTGSMAAGADVIASVRAWQDHVALPAIAHVRLGHPRKTATVDALLGKRLFDRVRVSLTVLQGDIRARAAFVKRELSDAARTSIITFIAIAAALLLSVIATALTLRNAVIRPLGRLTGASRAVAGGELSRSLLVDGPVEIAQLGHDVDTMRLGLLQQLDEVEEARAKLAAAATELERSNSELEQFAYVASHDLQEPLRKVTSFCQLLQERYAGSLDERADQYIEFAVDGARRMQQLINDLLAFSRVGRFAPTDELVDLNALAAGARRDLDEAVTAAGAEVVIGELPRLAVEPQLMRTVFQNLISNSLKFRSQASPRIRLQARREPQEWLFSCTDNGIGIEPDYAERVFVIFQRLHTRDRYEGTGIGLAMCRKIIEYHGGRIWVDDTCSDGARIWFTLPAQTTPAPSAVPPPDDRSDTMAP